MAVTADVYVSDDSLATNPIAGVVVSVLDSSTFVEVAQGITDVNGKASFVIPGAVTPGLTYEVRCFKLGVRFLNPFQIAVEEPVVTTNEFDVSGTLLTLPTSVDPRRCKCTGRFMNFSNDPIEGAVVRIMAKADSGYQTPKVVDGNLVSAETMALRTDSDGIISVDLLRGGEYYVTFSGEDDVVWCIVVPDRSSVNFIDLIHPAPVTLDWDDTDAPGDAISVAVGETKEVKYSVTFTDYQVKTSGVDSVVQITNSDGAVMEVAAGDGLIVVRGLVAGSAQVTSSMKEGFLPPLIPYPTITSPALVVTVTP